MLDTQESHHPSKVTDWGLPFSIELNTGIQNTLAVLDGVHDFFRVCVCEFFLIQHMKDHGFITHTTYP